MPNDNNRFSHPDGKRNRSLGAFLIPIFIFLITASVLKGDLANIAPLDTELQGTLNSLYARQWQRLQKLKEDYENAPAGSLKKAEKKDEYDKAVLNLIRNLQGVQTVNDAGLAARQADLSSNNGANEMAPSQPSSNPEWDAIRPGIEQANVSPVNPVPPQDPALAEAQEMRNLGIIDENGNRIDLATPKSDSPVASQPSSNPEWDAIRPGIEQATVAKPADTGPGWSGNNLEAIFNGKPYSTNDYSNGLNPANGDGIYRLTTDKPEDGVLFAKQNADGTWQTLNVESSTNATNPNIRPTFDGTGGWEFVSRDSHGNYQQWALSSDQPNYNWADPRWNDVKFDGWNRLHPVVNGQPLSYSPSWSGELGGRIFTHASGNYVRWSNNQLSSLQSFSTRPPGLATVSSALSSSGGGTSGGTSVTLLKS